MIYTVIRILSVCNATFAYPYLDSAPFGYSFAEKNPHLSKTNVGSFQLNPPYRVGEIIFDDEISYGDEIRLDGGWVDLISSALADFIRVYSDFIALARFH